LVYLGHPRRLSLRRREVGLPFGWFFLMIQGHWVEKGVGQAIAQGVRAHRVRLPDPDERALLRWAERPTVSEGLALLGIRRSDQ